MEVAPNRDKWLDCMYTDGSFMFSVYMDELPYTTVNLIIGELETYQESMSSKSFMIANSFVCKSQVSEGSYGDAFVVKDVYGLKRQPRELDLSAFADVTNALPQSTILSRIVDNSFIFPIFTCLLR